MRSNILVFVAHPDDLEIGMGGTSLKYSQQGKKIIQVIFSYGELSILKKNIIVIIRKKEAKKAGKLIGCKKIIFFGLSDGKISSEIKEKNVKEKVKKLIKQYKPIKIFTHSIDDLPDHKAVNRVVIETLDELKSKAEVYAFDIWNPTSLTKANYPKLFVDVTNTFDTKIKALKLFKSQKHVMLQLMPAVFLRAKLAGQYDNCKYAEKFYKIR